MVRKKKFHFQGFKNQSETQSEKCKLLEKNMNQKKCKHTLYDLEKGLAMTD